MGLVGADLAALRTLVVQLAGPMRGEVDDVLTAMNNLVQGSGAWDQPMQLCVLSAEPSGARMILLDAARAGLWLLTTEDSGALAPLSPHAAWRLLLTLIVDAAQARWPEKRAGL